MPLSLHAAMALAGSASVRLMMPGGEARPGELAMVGPLALASMAALLAETILELADLAGMQADEFRDRYWKFRPPYHLGQQAG
jgi:hypothetical protein